MGEMETNRSKRQISGPILGNSIRRSEMTEYERLLESKLTKKSTEFEKLQQIYNSVSVELLDTNKAIAVLVKKYERISENKEREIARRIDQDILPMVVALREASSMPKNLSVDLEVLAVRIKALIRELANGDESLNQLTPTELRVALLIRDGATTLQIADRLYVSESTVKTHRKNIRSKLNLQKRKINLANYLKDVL